MTVRVRQILLMLVSSSAVALAPMAFSVVVVPAISRADCEDAGNTGYTVDANQCGVRCPDNTVVDEQSGQCLDLWSGVGANLQHLPPPPGLGGSDLSGTPNWSALSGIPPLAQVNMPDLVLPSIGLGLVPDIPIILQPNFGQLPPPQLPDLTQLPPPQLPDLTQLPPPQLPDLTKLPPPHL
ncbi:MULTISPECIES: hypothetical protein [unclassified Mycobacterium]|uniref:hypothetical protein n=1 Tax=unclassified Mycobacterium TaxID=2642494 RepID=UPI0029C8EF52|nr:MULTISPECIES: hypothetical protein [unclassified Mycobacterium]